MCRRYSYLGSRRHGGFAEYVTVPQRNLIELPENVSFEEAAMMEPMAVAVHAMRRIAPTQTDTVVICGLGTIGILILMFLLEKGIKNILIICNKDFQKKTVIGMGISAENCCDSRIESVDEWIDKQTRGRGADVFFECVGKNETINRAINSTAAGGKIMLVGNPYSDISIDKSVYWKILRNQITVMGTWNSSFNDNAYDDWHYILNKLAEKKIRPEKLISHKFDMDALEKGLLIMKDKSEEYIKIMMRIV
jgi:L-iditol 2-dehydrogenase